MDGDGVDNWFDAFRWDPTRSIDSDFDGIEDAVDDDKDGDGIKNDLDPFPSAIRTSTSMATVNRMCGILTMIMMVSMIIRTLFR